MTACAYCDTVPIAGATRCESCGAGLPAPARAAVSWPWSSSWRAWPIGVWIAVILVSALVGPFLLTMALMFVAMVMMLIVGGLANDPVTFIGVAVLLGAALRMMRRARDRKRRLSGWTAPRSSTPL